MQMEGVRDMTNEEIIKRLEAIASAELVVDGLKVGAITKEAFEAIQETAHLAISALERDRWISVEESLPEDFQKVLVFWWEHSEPMIDTAFWQKDAKHFDGQHWVRMEDKVTHWRPLPEPPKEET